MTNIIIMGSQWGDEGKGKIVDCLAEQADLVIRFNGGHNAGHTLVVDGKTYKLALIPSGVVRGRPSFIGAGAVVDPVHFAGELTSLQNLGVLVGPDILKVADNATLILSIHQELDSAREEDTRAVNHIGTTKRGIGPAYEDKAGRRALKIADLRSPGSWRDRIEVLARHHDPLRLALGLPAIEHDKLTDELESAAQVLSPFAVNMVQMMAGFDNVAQRLLFEGAQGALLDPDFGTYPYVTSANTVAGAAAVGTGLLLRQPAHVLGVTKAYCTRVGSGPFPTELLDDTGEFLAQRGHEVGVNTGRKRRCGWLDAVALRHSARLNGMNGIALTKLDVLDGLANLKVCVGYELNGKEIDHVPTGMMEQELLRPIYRNFDGWTSSTRDLTNADNFPDQARDYISFIEDFVGVPITILSTGPDRGSTIMLQDPWRSL